MTAGVQVDPVAVWCPPGRPATIAGLDIRSGGFWIGAGPEPSAVDPYLPVDLRFPDWDGVTVRELRYDRLSPSARGAYLMWLATGRRAPQAPPAWAVLYLLGVERRLVLDADDDLSIMAEVRELGALYGPGAPAVAGLAAALDLPPRDVQPPPLESSPTAVPVGLAVELGRRALAGTPVTSEWALAWAWYHPDIALQDAARQAPDQFARLWMHRFDERYPAGMDVPPRRRRLVLTYEPGNPSLPRPLERTVVDASDVVDHPHPARVLRELTEAVEQELAPYARWVSRNGHEVSAGTAAALLPEALVANSSAGTAIEPLVEWTSALIAEGGPVTVAGRDLTARWTGDGSRSGVLAMIQVIERHGVGIEPDVRFGGRAIVGDDSPVVLFATGAEPTSTPSPAYVLAAVTTELCLAVAVADGSVDDTEAALLVDRIDRIDELTAAERLRLAAHRLLVAERRIDLGEVAARAEALPEPARRDLAETVVDIALADGTVTDDERRIVRAVHALLGIDADDERLEPEPIDTTPGPTTDEPRPEPEPEDQGFDDMSSTRADGESELDAVPPTPFPHEESESPMPTRVQTPPAPVAGVPAQRAVSLDEERLARTQASNADVRALLGAIFADDEDEAMPEQAATPEPAAPPEPEPSGQRIGPLDVRHSSLLNELAGAGSWSRPELERVCARLAVLPDGALDVVNEASYYLVGDPVIELLDDGSVAVDTDVLEEMRA